MLARESAWRVIFVSSLLRTKRFHDDWSLVDWCRQYIFKFIIMSKTHIYTHTGNKNLNRSLLNNTMEMQSIKSSLSCKKKRSMISTYTFCYLVELDRSGFYMRNFNILAGLCSLVELIIRIWLEIPKKNSHDKR